MKLDREYQREMLRRLADDYPELSPETDTLRTDAEVRPTP